jgi:hypothetical protein
MSEKGLIFRPDMIRAFLAGRKTQTRRIIKVPKNMHPINDGCGFGISDEFRGRWRQLWPYALNKEKTQQKIIPSPFQPGDVIRAKETYIFEHKWDSSKPSDVSQGEPVYYPADKKIRGFNGHTRTFEHGKTRPSIFMPKWVARIKRTVTSVRVEQVQDISRTDAHAEGFNLQKMCPFDWFLELWDIINGKGAWARNDLVWVYELEKK